MHRSFSVLLLSAGLFAQTPTATVTGIVKDVTGSTIPSAHVVAKNTQTNIARDAQTNDSGEYTIPLLPPGSYEVSVEAPAFQKAVQTGITLQIDQKARLDFTLTVGSVTDVVEVKSDAPLTDTDSAAVGTVIDNRKVVELPLNSREFYSLALLVPGTYQPAQGSTLGFRGGFNVAGSSEISNNFTLNGINNNDAGINGPSFRPSVDAIQEFKLLTGIYPAEYGHNSGGQVVVTTKSGSNGFHGTGFEFLRNQVLDARNFFTPPGPSPSFKRNQFGGTIGGPIVRNKTFFFFSYEGLRLRQQISALTTVPTPEMINGDFRALLPSKHVLDPLTGLDFPTQNVIPASRFNTVGRALLGYYPLPTFPTAAGALPSNNYNFSSTRRETLNQYSSRIDHTFSAKDSIYGTINYFSDPSFEPSNSLCGTRLLPGFGCDAGLTTQLYGAVWTHVFQPNLIHEARIGFNRLRQPRLQQDSTIDFNGTYGLQNFFSAIPSNMGVPQTSVTGFGTLGGATNIPQDRRDNTFVWVDNLIWTHGTHSIKVGTDLSRFQSNLFYVATGRGAFSFTGSTAAPTSTYPLADLLLGFPSTTSRNPYAPSTYSRTSSINVYAQDDWKITRDFTLNYGIRWELNTPDSERYGRNSSFNPTTGQIVYPGLNGYPFNLYQYDYNNFAPRLGFAWQPLHTSKTVIRGGSGRFYNSQAAGNGLLNLLFNSPFRAPQTFTSTKANPVSLTSPYPDANAASSNSPTAIARSFQTANIVEWSMGIEQQLSSNIVLDVTYFGSKGTHLPVNRNLNQPRPSAVQSAANRPYPTYGNITWIESVANSAYNSLQVKLEKRFSGGLSFLASYTWGKSIDDAPGISTSSAASSSNAQNALNLRGERGLSDFDVRQRFVFSPVYELPFGKWTHGALAKMVGGFQLSGILSFQTGRPLTAYYSGNFSNTFNSGTDRPDLIGNPNNGVKSVNSFFDTTAFAKPAVGQFGNEGRNVIQGPGFTNLDLSFIRAFKIRERVGLQFRWELFNTFNHPNFNYPNATADGSSFGKLTSALDPRQQQVAIKIIF